MYDLQMPVLAVEPQAALTCNEQMPQLGHLIPNINMSQAPGYRLSNVATLSSGAAKEHHRSAIFCHPPRLSFFTTVFATSAGCPSTVIGC
jgi:hypothetical protein